MKRLCWLLSVMLLSVPIVACAQAQTVTSTELIENALSLDGQTTVYTGEVIGDVMARGDHVWINVSDGSSAIGIWAEKEQVQGIGLTGIYGVQGDTVTVTGTFHRACAEHGGDLDIHAASILVTKQGHSVEKNVKGWRLVLGIGFTLVDAGGLAAYLFKRRRLL